MSVNGHWSQYPLGHSENIADKKLILTNYVSAFFFLLGKTFAN